LKNTSSITAGTFWPASFWIEDTTPLPNVSSNSEGVFKFKSSLKKTSFKTGSSFSFLSLVIVGFVVGGVRAGGVGLLGWDPVVVVVDEEKKELNTDWLEEAKVEGCTLVEGFACILAAGFAGITLGFWVCNIAELGLLIDDVGGGGAGFFGGGAGLFFVNANDGFGFGLIAEGGAGWPLAMVLEGFTCWGFTDCLTWDASGSLATELAALILFVEEEGEEEVVTVTGEACDLVVDESPPNKEEKKDGLLFEDSFSGVTFFVVTEAETLTGLLAIDLTWVDLAIEGITGFTAVGADFTEAVTGFTEDAGLTLVLVVVVLEVS
jgi:hypothetical protein